MTVFSQQGLNRLKDRRRRHRLLRQGRAIDHGVPKLAASVVCSIRRMFGEDLRDLVPQHRNGGRIQHPTQYGVTVPLQLHRRRRGRLASKPEIAVATRDHEREYEPRLRARSSRLLSSGRRAP